MFLGGRAEETNHGCLIVCSFQLSLRYTINGRMAHFWTVKLYQNPFICGDNRGKRDIFKHETNLTKRIQKWVCYTELPRLSISNIQTLNFNPN